MNKVCFFIHGIGNNNNTDKMCSCIKNILPDIEIVPIKWSDVLDTYELGFILKYSNIIGSIRKTLIYYAGDVIIYESFKTKIHERLRSYFKNYSDCEINVITHSFGSIIISDFLYDHPLYKAKNFFTIGSPLAFYSLRYGVDNFNKVINNVDNWINVWNYYDAVSYPLKPLNKEYDRVVKKDIDYNKSGLIGLFFKLAHSVYFSSNNLNKIIKENWLL